MRNKLLIQQVHAYAPEDLGRVDILIEDGKISAIGPHINAPEARTLPCDGLTAIPGLIETHAHMLLPFGGTCTCNDFWDGTLAGAFGGVTTLIDFADQQQGGSIRTALSKRLNQAADQCAVDYGFHCTLTHITDDTLDMIPILVEEGYSSFKFYTTYSDGGLYVSYPDMERAFRRIAAAGGIATVHAEDEAMIQEATHRLMEAGKTGWQHFPLSKPSLSETSAVGSLIALARQTGVKLLIRHVSSGEAARQICAAQREGLEVYGETCPHYLCFEESVYSRPDGADYIVHPPIRTADDRAGLWDALRSDAAFTIGTDDCAFYRRQKRVSSNFYEVPGGMPGIETRLPVLYELGVYAGRITMERLCRLTSELPAKLYGLYPRKGCLRTGSDGDVTLISTDGLDIITASNLHEKSDYTPFEGMPLHMHVEKVIANGKVCIDAQQSLLTPGIGRLLHRGLPQSALPRK